MDVSPEDVRALIQDKYGGDEHAPITEDLARLSAGEPLAYVIGWVPFLGCRIALASRPLIPRVETEYWTERLITHLRERFGDTPFSLLDMCAGSGAIGVAVLKHLKGARVTFAELSPTHASDIRTSLEDSGIDLDRATILVGDLFTPLEGRQFDIIATNPPYVPMGRVLEPSVADYEPAAALYAGGDGLSLIRRIFVAAPRHLLTEGEVWLECDATHAEAVATLARAHGAQEAAINEDQYGRPRFVVSYYR